MVLTELPEAEKLATMGSQEAIVPTFFLVSDRILYPEPYKLR
jgi:hypothetical protein